MRILLLTVLLFFFQLHAQTTRWSVKIDSTDIFSSPRFVDLNKDGVKDVVIGGGIESVPSSHGVIALNGANGDELWSVPAYTQIYTSALFQDIDGDDIADVFIGGRAACFFAISGATGKVLWKFWDGNESDSRRKGYLNFYSTQWLDDQNGDGFKDLLVANGGDYLAPTGQTNRPRAVLMILSGKDGSMISNVKFPEDRESYYAPHIHFNKRKANVLFGSGGETIDGKLWQVPLKSVQKGHMKKAKIILADSNKGFILNSVLADLTGNNKQDIISARMNGSIVAVDGCRGEVLWRSEFPGYECYVTPSLGNFTGDETPDIFTIMGKGTFPQYTTFKLVVIDGKTGELAWSEESGFNQFSPGISVDMDGDGIDEIIYVQNKLKNPETYEIGNQLRVVNIAKNTSAFLGDERSGISMASSPGIVDLENDGKEEVIVATSSLDMGQGAQYSIIECIDLLQSVKSISWPGYLGLKENGLFK